jgi:hypothetical protein
VIYIFARTLRRALEPGEFAVAGVCLVVAAFQVLYLAISMEPTMYERNDWLVLWIPLAVFATGRHLPARALRVTLLILAGLPPFVFATWSFGRESDHKEIRQLRAEHPRVVFDNSHFNNPESPRGSSNFSEIGAVELAGLERCYVLAENTQGYLPLRCSFLTEKPLLARRTIEAQPEPFALTRAARIRLGYIALDITCENLVERYTHCARKRTMMVDKQAAQFRRQVREFCDSFPEMLSCFEKSPDNCDSLHICVVESLRNGGKL